MKLKDFKGFFRKSYLEVVSVDNPHSDYYLIKLKTDNQYNWVAGEHASFSIPSKEINGKKWRAFSIASIDEEGFMLIGTRTGKEISSFKQALINLEPGERVGVRGPFGWFKINDETSPIILFASGVGVTPIRALLKQIEHNTNRETHVVYASSEYYLFEDEIKTIVEKNPKMQLTLTSSRTMTQKKLSDLSIKYGNTAYYYVSGSMPVINSTKELLKEHSINNKRIINDPFFGY